MLPKQLVAHGQQLHVHAKRRQPLDHPQLVNPQRVQQRELDASLDVHVGSAAAAACSASQSVMACVALASHSASPSHGTQSAMRTATAMRTAGLLPELVVQL